MSMDTEDYVVMKAILAELVGIRTEITELKLAVITAVKEESETPQ